MYGKQNLVFQKVSDLVVFCTGTRDQNHARVAKVIECFLLCLIEVLKKNITEERIVKNYAKVCVVLDEILNEVSTQSKPSTALVSFFLLSPSSTTSFTPPPIPLTPLLSSSPKPNPLPLMHCLPTRGSSTRWTLNLF